MENTTIGIERLKELEKLEQKLRALETTGVDNWEGYGIAMEEINKQEEIDFLVEETISEIEEALGSGVFEPSERGDGYSFTDTATFEAIKVLEDFIVKYNELKQR